MMSKSIHGNPIGKKTQTNLDTSNMVIVVTVKLSANVDVQWLL